MRDDTTHSTYSDPGPWAARLAELPPDIEAIAAAVRNVIVHYRAGGYTPTGEHLYEIDNRWVSRILDVDQARHPTPLTAPREIEGRVAGCCRDFTLLTVAGLREHGIRARSRIGFGGYLAPGWHYDHVVVEVFDGDRSRLWDAQLEPGPDWTVDVTDVPRTTDGFLTAADVWTRHRRGELDVDNYGVDPDFPFRGEWFVRNYVLGELAHRQGDELLLWDLFGDMRGPDGEGGPYDVEIIDEIAASMLAADAGDTGAEAQLADRYARDMRLHPGRHVVAHSPTGRLLNVDLATRESTITGTVGEQLANLAT
jgi:Transglutaminase-like superfamily